MGDHRRRAEVPRTQAPLPREVFANRDDPIHVSVPFSKEGSKSGLQVMDEVNYARLQMIRFAAPIHDIEEESMPAPEGDMVSVAHLDAPHIADAHAVERIVHEVLERGEHRRRSEEHTSELQSR